MFSLKFERQSFQMGVDGQQIQGMQGSNKIRTGKQGICTFQSKTGPGCSTTIQLLLDDAGALGGKGVLLLQGATAMTTHIESWITLAQSAPDLNVVIFEVANKILIP